MTEAPSRMLAARPSNGVAVALVVVLLAPSLAFLMPHCVAAAGEGCAAEARTRCPGLWSNDCCDFAAPAAGERSASPRPSPAATVHATAAVTVASVTPPDRLDGPPHASRSPGGGTLQAALLEATVLLL